MFSRGLRKLRADKQLTQTELAERVGISQTMISEYEKGRKKPTLDVVVLIADTLRCSVDDLLERRVS